MKKIVSVLVLLTIAFAYSFAQRQVKVTLKTGMTVTGEMKSFDPMSSMVIVVAGQETTIPADKISNVEELNSPASAPAAPQPEKVPTTTNPLIVTDNADYPETVDVDILGEKYPFILVRGGDYLMGYDGRGSRSMHSEPIHRVKVTTFYISSKPLTEKTAEALMGNSDDDNDTYTYILKRNREAIMAGLERMVKIPLRLPTDAEWEYAAVGPQKNKIFLTTDWSFDVCQDGWYEFSNGPVETDPTHIISHGGHVTRKFCGFGRLPYTRLVENSVRCDIRLAIKAKDLLKYQH